MNKPLVLRTHARVAGHFTLRAYSKARGWRVLADFDNMILDIGLDRLGHTSAASCWTFCRVGSGTTAPAADQTALVSQIASTSSVNGSISNSYVAGPPPYVEALKTFRFAEGVAAGTLAEVGVGWTDSGATLFSRARILDSGGSPTTITVLSDETLDVDYRIRLYPPTDDAGSTVTISGVEHTIVVRTSTVNTAWSAENLIQNGSGSGGVSPTMQVYNGTLGATTGSPSGTSSSIGFTSRAAYSAGSHQRDFLFTAALNQGNLSGGISAIRWSNTLAGTAFQASLDPPIAKDATKVLTLTVRNSWGRV